MQKKLVDVYVKSPCLNAYTVLKTDCYGVELSLADIRINISRGNQVYEILNNGQRLFLDSNNYDKDNNKAIGTKTEEVKPVATKPVAEELAKTAEVKKPVILPKKEEEPVKVEEEKVEEVKPVENKKQDNVNNKNNNKK